MSRPTVSRPVCLGVKPHPGPKPDFCYCPTVAGLLLWGALSDERTGSVVYNCCWRSAAQSFSDPRLDKLMIIFYCLRFGTPLTWRVRSPYLYTPGTEWPNYTPGSGFPFRHLLRLAGLWWKYSNPPPHGRVSAVFRFSRYISWADLTENTSTCSLFITVWRGSCGGPRRKHCFPEWLHCCVTSYLSLRRVYCTFA
jgi:hypothetical protein